MNKNVSPRKIELLAPAKDAETAIVAINQGADAVYMGALQFGARHAAGNSVEDIARVVEYAHLFDAKVYVTLNTIIDDEDILVAEQLVSELYNVGVDALIVQDLGITKMNIPPIPLHSSTQMDNRTADKVRFLADAGFERVVLARELSLTEIADVHRATPDTELEVFVHGALCVSYSGQCYASQYCFGRSANRGECAQFCRLAFDLVDAAGRVVCKDKHLLSLKDMNRSAHLEAMLDAGVMSLKIEGRLKSPSYVKNIVAYYRALLDEIFSRRSCYVAASKGRVSPQFTPSPEKSFNRGFTDYLLVGDKRDITSFDSPKSKGEYIGRVKFAGRDFFTYTGDKKFNNGDGACIIGSDGKLHGFRINRVEGNRIFPQSMPAAVEGGVELYRNYDIDFERQISRPDVPRRLSLELVLKDCNDGFVIVGKDELGIEASVMMPFEHSEARTSQHDNIVKQLSKWGGTPFEVAGVDVQLSGQFFIPSSLLGELRRRLCDALLDNHKVQYVRRDMPVKPTSHTFPSAPLDYRANVSNSLAKAFYAEHGVPGVAPAFEKEAPEGAALMFCKHCIKYSFGWCSRNGKPMPFREPLYIVSGDGKHFRLQFNCKECIMQVMAE